MNRMEEWLERILTGIGVSADWAMFLRLMIVVFALAVVSWLVFVLTKRVILHYIYRIFKRSSVKWDDKLVEGNALNGLVHIAPAVLIRFLAPGIFADFDQVLPFAVKLADAYLIIGGMTIFFAFLRVAELVFENHDAFKDKPLNSYSQLIRIILYCVTIILVLSALLGKSPVYFLSAFGAMTAILLLVFKDTILGLVASVQISANDMVRVGDWVEMPKFNADGDVIAINLNTVKVQNWDKTITTIPTYFFITDSFKNWRGMVQTGARRIKRAIQIDAHSVKFVSPEFRERLKKYDLISGYVETRQKEIEQYNEAKELDTSIHINGRRMTNIGVFREYMELYMKHHAGIHKGMTTMVRQLTTEGRGIPLEIYCFTNTTNWLQYEDIQSDVFDHLYAAATFFELDIFQEPSGKDFSALSGQFAHSVS